MAVVFLSGPLTGDKRVGNIYADIELSNPKDSSTKPLFVYVVVDNGVKTLCMPDHIANLLKMEEIEKCEVVDEDGKSHLVSSVGPVEVKYEGRSCTTTALVMSDSILLGAGLMEKMGLVVSQSGRSIVVRGDKDEG